MVPEAVYLALVRLCARNIRQHGARNVTDADAAKFPTLNFDTVLTVFRQQYQRHIRRTSHLHRDKKVCHSLLVTLVFGLGERIGVMRFDLTICVCVCVCVCVLRHDVIGSGVDGVCGCVPSWRVD